MPTRIPIASNLRDALLECFAAVVSLARPELRSEIVLVGGAASIVHNSP